MLQPLGHTRDSQRINKLTNYISKYNSSTNNRFVNWEQHPKSRPQRLKGVGPFQKLMKEMFLVYASTLY